MTELRFGFDFSCPYAYLASTQVRELARRAGAQLIYEPFLLGGVFNALGGAAPDMARMPAPRARLNALDMRRWAEHWRVPLNMPETHPNRTVLALRATLASGQLERASHALFDAYWGRGLDISKPEVVASALNGAGLEGSLLVERANDAGLKEELRQRTDRAIASGVFGAPALFVDGQLYWGQDRLDFVARALGLSGYDEPPPAPQQAAPELEFWYDFSSPFAYLAATQVPALAERTGSRVVWRPFLLGALFRAIGTPDVPLHSFAPAKQRYLELDLKRFAAHYGVPFAFPRKFPLRSVKALRLALLSGERIADLSRALFDAIWAQDLDVTDEGVLREVCRRAGVDAALLERTSDDRVKAELRRNTERAERLGLCGAPSFRVAGLLFWGQDRLGLVERALGGWRPEGG